MAEVVDELFVKLGLEQDEQQFEKAEESFAGLRRTALGFGAVAGTAAVAATGLSASIAQNVDETNKLAELFRGLEVTPQFINNLKAGFRDVGEDAQAAEGIIRNMADIIEDIDFGEINDNVLRESNVINLGRLSQINNVPDLLGELNNQLSRADDEEARRTASAFGLSDEAIRILRDRDINDIRQRGQELRPLSPELSQQSDEFVEELGELTLRLEDAGRVIAENVLPRLNTGLNFLNRSAERADELEQVGGDGFIGSSARLATGFGLEFAETDIAGSIASAGQSFSDTVTGAADSLTESIFGRDQSDLSEFAFSNRAQGLNQQALDTFSNTGAVNFPGLLPNNSLLPTPVSTTNTSQVQDITINVDARNAQDPQAARDAARRGTQEAINQAADNTIKDLRTPVE